MIDHKSLFRTLLIPSMLFLGACCCEKDVVVAPEPPPPPPVAQPVVQGPVLGDVFYDYDKSLVRAEAAEQLKTNAAWIQANGSRNVVIEGHCDERGTNEYNLALGERRAISAKENLLNLGIPANRLKTVSFGEERPFAVGHDEESWAQNRRAHFVAE